MRLLLSMFTALLLPGVMGCTEPIEPGSDLDDPAPAAELGALQDYEIMQARFLLEGMLANEFSPAPLPMNVYALTLDKQGDLTTSQAIVTGTLGYEFPTDAEPVDTVEPSPASIDGSFVMSFSDVKIPPNPDMPDAAPLTGTMVLNAQIQSADCVAGSAVLTLDTLELDFVGDFIATREGSDATCTQAMEDAQ